MHLRPYTGIIAAAAVFVVSLVFLGAGVRVGSGGQDSPPFHIDEAHKLSETFYYHLLFERRSVRHPAWTHDFYARTNPPVAKYVFGAALAAAGLHVRDQTLQNDFERLWRQPEELRRHVPDAMLRVTRGVSVTYGALVCLLIFLIGRRVAGTTAGVIAAVLVLGNSHFQRYAQRGLTDTILMFHLTLIAPVLLWSAAVLHRHWAQPDPRSAVRHWAPILLATVIVPGLVIALAAGTKLNGALTGPVYALGLIVSAAARPRAGQWPRRVGLAVLMAGLAAVVAVTIFVAINPYFHHHPLDRAAETLRAFQDWMVKQQITPGGGLFSLREKVTAVGYFALLGPSLPLVRYLGVLGVWVTVLGFAAGVVIWTGRCLPRRRPVDQTSKDEADRPDAYLDARMVLGWVLLCVGVITLWLPICWDRYLLPPYLAIALVTAVGLAGLPWAVQSIVDRLSGQRERGSSVAMTLGVVATVGLWGVLALTSWPVQPALLDPMVVAPSGPAADQRYANAVEADPDCPVLRHHLGLARLRQGKVGQAAEQFDASLSLLDRHPRATRGVAVQRCCVLYDLARARSAMGDAVGALAAVEGHLAAIKWLRDSMVSRDPKVRAEFNCVIAEREAARARLVNRPATRAGRPCRPR